MIKKPRGSPPRGTVTSQMLQPDKQKLTFFEGIVDGCYETDLPGTLIIANSALCRIFGCTDASEIVGYQYTKYMDEANARKMRQAFQEVFETGEPKGAVECQIKRADGEQRTVEVSISLLRDRKGEPTGFRGIVRDVTERAHAEAAKNHRLDLLGVLQQVDVELNDTLALEAVLDVALNAAIHLSSADAGFIGLIEGDQVRVVRAFGACTEKAADTGIVARVIQAQRSELVIETGSDPASRAEIAIPLLTHYKIGGVLSLETAAPERFTSEVFESAQLLGARIAAALENASLYEILQKRLIEQQRLYMQVSDLEQLKTDMIRIAAHDLRGPLSVIASYIELLNDDLQPYFAAAHPTYIQSIRQAVARMTQMSSDILSLERLNEHRDVTLARVQLGKLVEAVAGEYMKESRNHQMRLRVELAAVYGDESELREAITNLISNAVKYTPHGGRIEIRLLREDEEALVEIDDTGYGIPQNQQGLLFQPFQRVKTEETYRIDGTGLGLYLVKKIVERHGGTVHFRSQYGKGSVFGFRLPLAKHGD